MGQTSSNNLQPTTGSSMGLNGINGAMGPTGLNGKDGLMGPMGPMGPAGLNGKDGLMGPMGPAGPMGLNGKDGAMGPAGPMGPMGLNGKDGAMGPVGPAGPMGPAGSGLNFQNWRIVEKLVNNKDKTTTSTLCFYDDLNVNNFCLNSTPNFMNITTGGVQIGYPVFDDIVVLRNYNNFVNKEIFATQSGGVGGPYALNTNAALGTVADPPQSAAQFMIQPAPAMGGYYIIHADSGLYLGIQNPATAATTLILTATPTLNNNVFHITNAGRVGSYYITSLAGHIINFSYNASTKGGVFVATRKGAGYYTETSPEFNQIQIQRATAVTYANNPY